nr:RNA polymerase sigma factor [uncultured Carboxylicivirga sp.]
MKNKEQQFNELVSDHGNKIMRICSYYNSDPDEQKDMYQEILINIWNSLHSFRGDAAISTWIYRIAVNTSLSFTGKSFRQMKLIVKTDTSNIHNLLDEDETENKVTLERKLNQLQTELNQLSVIDKSLITLLLEGLTMREIADIIGITEPNVKVKIHRIKEQLKTKLKPDGHE